MTFCVTLVYLLLEWGGQRLTVKTRLTGEEMETSMWKDTASKLETAWSSSQFLKDQPSVAGPVTYLVMVCIGSYKQSLLVSSSEEEQD